MTRRINPALLAALYLALTLPALAAGKVPMWKAVLGSSEVYLLGSIHVAKAPGWWWRWTPPA